jgi:DNA-binding response OmpR family regulator
MNTIVVIEEDEVTQQAVNDLLKRSTTKTISVNEAEQVLEAVRLRGHCLVVISSPPSGDKGAELCNRIDTLGLRTPLTVSSGDREPSEETLRLETAVNAHVARPSGECAGIAHTGKVPRCSAPRSETRIRFGDVEIDIEHRYVRRSGHTLKLTRGEYNLLLFLVSNVDQAITREAILNEVWGYECYPTTRTVDAHVVKLRKKLEPDPRVPRYLLTVHGVGYRFVMSPANTQPSEDILRGGEALAQAGVFLN